LGVGNIKEGTSSSSPRPPLEEGATDTSESQKPQEEPRKITVSIDDPEWPAAIPESAIVKTEPQKWARANTVLTKFEKMRGPVLDFGCGEGHITATLNEQDIKTLGYDINPNDLWDKIGEFKQFTTEWESVVEQGPYSSILLHDVIDHVEKESVSEILAKISDVLEENGRVYIMAHPFSSRHGGHLYEKNNLAYLHMIISDAERASNYPDAPPNQKITKPQGQYSKLLTEKFTIVNKKVIPQQLEPWVLANLLPEIKEVWYPKLDIERVEKILEIGGIYYTLEKLSNPV
jgi:2-polyprenyl-3-methyl-5-hydroxy-6-metoxy-1,4-benzoquinol methylase